MSEPEPVDYSTLPLEERLTHKVWKARLDAYNECIKQFDSSRNEEDECFVLFNQSHDLLKKIVTDSNVVAQETGIMVLLKYLELGATPSTANRLKNGGIVSALCEKGLSSSRAGTKAKTTDCLLSLVEIVPNGNGVAEDILPFFKHRLPKLVAGCVAALAQLVQQFGCVVISPSPIIEQLPKLFAHGDKNVRLETTKLTVELFKWMKDGLRKTLFEDLKPVQQKDLTKAFEEVEGVAPQQLRLTRAQQEAEASKDMEVDSAPSAASASGSGAPGTEIDPFDLLEPTEVLSKFPGDLSSRVNDPIWKERKAVMEEVVAVLSKTAKLTPKSDYTDIIRICAKCMKDANIQVVQLAANTVEFLAKGLKKNFHRYYSTVLLPMLDRNKEKKPAVADALNNALFAIFESTSLNDVLEATILTMGHKTPQVKISATNYLQKCLSETTVPPNKNDIETVVTAGVKLLSESQEPIRQAGTQLVGTLMKITGERELKQSLEKVDDNRKAKIFKFFETVEVKSSSSAGPSRSATKAPSKATSMLKKPTIPASSTVPSKRLATSPMKQADQGPTKISSYNRGLTGRPLASNSTVAPRLSPIPAKNDFMEIDGDDMNELKQLRSEKQQWIETETRQKKMIEDLKTDNLTLQDNNKELNRLVEMAKNDSQSVQIMIQDKDIKISRLNSEIETLKLQVKGLETSMDLIKLQQESTPTVSTEKYGYIPSFKSPQESQRINSGDLSSGVNRLSIDGDQKENHEAHPPVPKVYENNSGYGLEARNQDWIVAADVTSQLKERIRKMKARANLTTNHI